MSSAIALKIHDERFARIMFTTFIGSDQVAKNFRYDPLSKTAMLMKGNDNCFFQFQTVAVIVFISLEIFNVRVNGDGCRAV